MTMRMALLLLAVPAGFAPIRARAQSSVAAASDGRAPGGGVGIARITSIPEKDFEVSGLHRFLFGRTYRELWTHPIRVAVADLSKIGGGLEAKAREGAPGSRPFQLDAADGRVFGFRGLVKDATLDWPERLRTGLARRLARDQISGTIPGGALAVVQLERAAGVLSPGISLVRLPDDKRMGEWREEFAHSVGILEPRLRGSEAGLRSVPGARELLNSKELFERLRCDPNSSVDARAFLRARLVDLLVGDWDRHEGQWTWARFDHPRAARTAGVEHRWEPIPSDRDWAFTRLDGTIWALARMIQPKFTKFDGRFTGLGGLSIRPMALDRRLLVSLSLPEWDSVVANVVARLDDRAIEAAVRALPEEFDTTRVGWLRSALQQRRDQLPGVARAFYLDLASVVEVWATEGSDRIRLEETQEGALRLTVERGAGEGGIATGGLWTRRFQPAETREIRVYMLGGADSVMGRLERSPILVRLVDDGGGPLHVDRAVAAARVYDSTRSFHWPLERHSPEAMFRDWGGGIGIAPWVDYRDDVGFVLGAGPALVRYGFRRIPYASRLALRAAYTTGFAGINFDFTGDFRSQQRGRHLVVHAEALRADAVRYYGFGNETASPEPRAFYAVRQHRYQFDSRLALGLGEHMELSLGGLLRFQDQDDSRPSFALQELPYGFGRFTELGATAGWQLDLRDSPGYPTKGILARLNARYFPALADVRSAFGVMEGELSAYATAKFLPARPTLAVRAGGSRAWGDLPYFEAPAIGARTSVRGYYPRRFTGEASLYGSAELRLDFGGTPVIPGEWGVYGLGDLGRVSQSGERSDTWHGDWGVGLWFAPFGARKSTLTATYARSRESGRFYVTSGFHF